MFLKFRYQLGYETLVAEVQDSITWRLFCRIPLDMPVPHSTTLIKLTKKYGDETLEELNTLLVQKARRERIIKAKKLRIDTTVVEADIKYPTDAGLLADGVRLITRTVKRIKAVVEKAGETVVSFCDQTRRVKKELLAIGKVLKRRSGEAVKEVRRITEKLVTVANKAVAQAKAVLDQCKDKSGAAVARLITALDKHVAVTEQVIAQTKEVQSGNPHVLERIVSLFDPEARPIRKGKLKSPTEFGRKLILEESEERVIVGFKLLNGNPADKTLLEDSIKRYQKVFHRPPLAVSTDRGFYSKDNEEMLRGKYVRQFAIPKPGKLSAERKQLESSSRFKRLQKWRAGGEGTIGLLKRKYGLRRSLFRGTSGNKCWVAFSILTYNFRRIAMLSLEKAS
jgi:IS5 family transposase